MITIDDLITRASAAVSKFRQARDWSAANHWDGRRIALEQAKACRLTDAETAVIEAALEMTGERSPRLAMALACLRTERGLTGETTAQKVVSDAAPRSRLPECDDCGSSFHATDSVYCPVRQQDDRDE